MDVKNPATDWGLCFFSSIPIFFLPHFNFMSPFHLLFVKIVIYGQHGGRGFSVFPAVVFNHSRYFPVQQIDVLHFYQRDIIKGLCCARVFFLVLFSVVFYIMPKCFLKYRCNSTFLWEWVLCYKLCGNRM